MTKDRNGKEVKIGSKIRLPINSVYRKIYRVDNIEKISEFSTKIFIYCPEKDMVMGWAYPNEIEVISTLQEKILSIKNKIKNK